MAESEGDRLRMAGAVGSFINALFMPHRTGPLEDLLRRHKLSADKIRQITAKLLIAGIQDGTITKADLQE
ncbi:hypothetical protein KW786_00635 [Candidatus Parcubacteria bacterium]|nr:hypothetical protein [Candidatus Parcubacteria bacterium]